MNKLFILALSAITATIICSCQSAAPAKKVATTPQVVRTYTAAPVKVAPDTKAVGPVCSYKPIFTVDKENKIVKYKSAKVKGGKDAARQDAISKAILEKECDDIFVVSVVYEEYDNGETMAYLSGYPVTVSAVEEIPVVLYEQDKDGNIKDLEKLQNKLIFRQPYFYDEVIKGEEGQADTIVKKEVPGCWTYYPYAEGKFDAAKEEKAEAQPAAPRGGAFGGLMNGLSNF